MLKIKGVIPALVTPIDNSESIDEKSLERLLEHLISSGVSGVFPLGSMGEFAPLEDKEKFYLLEKVVEVVNKRIPVLAGVSDTGTKRVIRNILKASEIGVDAVVSVPPFFYFLNQKGVSSFYTEIAERSPLPVVIYHNPIMTKIKLEFDTVAEISKHQNIIGIKDSSCDYEFFSKLLSLKSNKFFVLQGDERRLKEALLAGADGLVTGVGNVAIKIFIELYEATKERRIKEAEELQNKVNQLLRFCKDSWIQAIKYGLKLQGICDDYTCRPFCPADKDTKKTVESTLKELGIL
ncbi:MAG: dihydrodipicolinate synthase family protein [bacterium]|nr:dihydrodipicolinate synthase family protein [bacterium]